MFWILFLFADRFIGESVINEHSDFAFWWNIFAETQNVFIFFAFTSFGEILAVEIAELNEIAKIIHHFIADSLIGFFYRSPAISESAEPIP